MRKSMLVLPLTLSIFTLCGNVMAKPVVINYWGVWDGAFKTLEKDVVDAFNKQYEGRIFVKASAVPGDSETKTITAQTGGVGPDIFKLDRFKVGSWASKNLLVNLDPMIKKDKVDPGVFFKPTWDENMYGGKVFGLPWNTDARGMYYNKTLFKQSGLNPDDPPRTWDEVRAMSKKIDYSQAENGRGQASSHITATGISRDGYGLQAAKSPIIPGENCCGTALKV